MTCKQCGNQFEVNWSGRKYCSPLCCSNSLRKHRICEACGVTFWRRVGGGVAKKRRAPFCSKACAYRSLTKQPQPPFCVVFIEKCDGCDKIKTWRRAKHRHRICSPECSERFHRQRYEAYKASPRYAGDLELQRIEYQANLTPTTNNCEICLEPFTVVLHGDRLTCDSCKERSHRKVDRTKRTTGERRECVLCGKSYLAVQVASKYCSGHCSKWMSNRSEYYPLTQSTEMIPFLWRVYQSGQKIYRTHQLGSLINKKQKGETINESEVRALLESI